MKCSHCGVDSTKKEREDGKCKACHRPFAFDPQKGDTITDFAFAAAVNRVSMDGTVKFLPTHVLARLEQSRDRARRGRRQTSALVVGGIALAIGIAALVVNLALLAVALALGAVSVLLAGLAALSGRETVDERTFAAWWQRWVQTHGVPKGAVVLDDAARNRPAPAAALAEEVLDYSFDRAVVCDRDDIAELLLANDFHFENNCAVLSANGHPRHAFPTVLKMLRNNPRIEVFALHDCTPAGCALAHTLRERPEWFQGIGSVYDVGLRPGQAGPWHARSVVRTVPPSPALTEAERAWLSSHELSLDVVPPEQLIKRLFRSMNRLPEVADAGGGDAGGFTMIGTTSDGGGDAFG